MNRRRIVRMQLRSRFVTPVFLALAISLSAPLARAQDDSAPKRGRKYKAPPETSHIEVHVLKDSNGKAVSNAAVVFHAVKDGKDEGNLEVKTNEEGRATIDVIATGSDVEVQVIADGFATYAGDYLVNDPSKSIEIKMIRPRAQISTYTDNSGKTSERPIGVQEPATPATLPGSPIQVPQQTPNQQFNQRPGLQATPTAPKSTPTQQKPVQSNPPTTSPLDTPNPYTSSPIQTNPPPSDRP